MAGGMVRFRVRKQPRHIDRALRHLVGAAYRNVPIYRRLWNAHEAEVFRFRTKDDLASLPVVQKTALAKGDLRDRVRRGVDPEQCVRRGTSGMTGPPIDILFGRLEFRFRQFQLLRRVVRDLGARGPFRWAEAGAWIPPERRVNPLPRGRVVAILSLPRALRPEEQIEALERFRPDVISGCPSDLQLIGTELARLGRSELRPGLVICRGEVLRPDVEDLLRAAFGCRVTDYYNVQEVGNLAWRCPDHPDIMHVNSDTAVLEIVDSSGNPVPPGTEGDVLVTNLTNTTMPFIRYSLGDRAAWIDPSPRRCSCGIRSALLSPIRGRSDDLIRLPDGRCVSPRAVDDLVTESLHATPHDPTFQPGLFAYQVVQEAVDRLVVRIEGSTAPSPLVDAMEAGLREIHPALKVAFESVDRLPRGETGKIQRVVSQLESER